MHKKENKKIVISHATIHTSFCPGIICFWEFLSVEKCFDFQNQMQPHILQIHSIEWDEFRENQTNSSCQAQTCVQGLQPEWNQLLPHQLWNNLRLFSPQKWVPESSGTAAELKAVLQCIFFHITYYHDLFSPTVFRKISYKKSIKKTSPML